MARSAWLRSVILSLFLLVPFASPAGAAEKAPARQQQDRGFVAWVWHAVSEIQKSLLPGTPTKADSRGTMDPDGLTSTVPRADSGPGMDPDGHS